MQENERKECDKKEEEKKDRKPRILLFEHRNFEGRCIELTAPTPHLCKFGFDNKVSSIRVIRGEWKLFECPDFEGREVRVNENGGPCRSGDYPCPMTWCGENDTISSLYPTCE